MTIMRQSWLYSGLLSVPLLMATGGIAVAQDHAHIDPAADTAVQTPAAAMRKVRWSDASAWPNGRVPVAGDEVTIARDLDMVLDVTPPALRSLTVDGKLTFSNERDLELMTDWIY